MVTMETPIKTAYRIYNVHIMYSSRACDSEAVVYWMASQILILKIYDTHTADDVLLLIQDTGGRTGARSHWINRVCYNYGTVHYSNIGCFSCKLHHTNATTVGLN